MTTKNWRLALPQDTIPYVADRLPKRGKLTQSGMSHILLDVPSRSGGALLAALEETSFRTAARLETQSAHPREEANTLAVIALRALIAQLRQQGFVEDTAYGR